MTARVGGRVLLALALVAVAFSLRGRATDRSPERAVRAWLDAAARGDDRTCLALSDGALRTALASVREQQGPAAFRAGLRDWMAGLRGVALSRSGGGAANDVELDIELVFDGRNERQRARLVRRWNGWRLARLDGAVAVAPPIRYGTPAFD